MHAYSLQHPLLILRHNDVTGDPGINKVRIVVIELDAALHWNPRTMAVEGLSGQDDGDINGE